ncbi:Ornithine cyclodeaminase [Candidatus Burkholderia humilis]|nr:Ornithine cyclodeaminase [Candidatus Burkholderia humilis]
MSTMGNVVPSFRVVTGKSVDGVLKNDRRRVIDVVEAAYRRHYESATVNPDSYFLRFPESPADRIIALPAHIQSGSDSMAVTGIKWISSFPGNLSLGVPRASAVLILNDATTGYPTACLEASIISATRTAASATSATRQVLTSRDVRTVRLAIIGAGLISRYVVDYLTACGIELSGVRVYDLNTGYARETAERLKRMEVNDVVVASSVEDAARYGEVVLFATTAATPHVTDSDWFSHNLLVLHLSLRDLSTDIILSSYNIVDDVDHCLKAQTSLHLTEIEAGNRDFVTTSLPAMLAKNIALPRDRPVIFSPFGMGILDLALGQYVLSVVNHDIQPIDDFFFDLTRI